MHNWKNLLKLLASVTAVQLIGFALLPLFSRLYTKADYGILGMLMSFVGLLTPLASLRYDQAAFVARTGHRLQLLRFLGIALCLGLSLLLSIVCLIIPPWLRETSYAPAIPYLFIIPLTVFSSGMFSIIAANANAKARYGSISLASLVQGYINNGLKVICGWLSMGVWGFAVAFNSGMFLASSILGIRHRENWKRGVTLHRLRVVAHHYRSFPKYTTWMVTTAMLISNILAMLLPLHYKVEEIGIITMLYMITRRPVQVYSDTTSRIYARRLVEANEEKRDFRPDMQKVAFRLSTGAIFALIVTPWVSEALISLVLGKEWAMLGKLIPWMIGFLLMESINYIFNFIPDALGKQRNYLVIQLIRFAVELSFISLLAPRLEFFDFIRAYFLFAAIEYALINYWFYRILPRYANE